MSDAEQEKLQALVHKIATHIVEGSAAVQELKATVARLQNERSDIEYAVYENWLKAAKTIEAAGKNKSSWENFIKSLKLSYGHDKPEVSAAWEASKEEENSLLVNASRELWTHGAKNNAEIIDHKKNTSGNEELDSSTSYYAMRTQGASASSFDASLPVDPNLVDPLKPKSELLAKANINMSAFNRERLVQAAMTIGEPDYKNGNKRKLDDCAKLDDREGSKKKKTVGTIHFKDGKKLLVDQVRELKKGGKCFYCEKRGHLALACRLNPVNQGK